MGRQGFFPRKSNTTTPPSQQQGAAQFKWKFKKHGQSGMDFSEIAARLRLHRRRDLPHPQHAHRREQSRPIHPRPQQRPHRQVAGPRWAVGSPTASARKTKTCPPTWCCATRPTCPCSKRAGTGRRLAAEPVSRHRGARARAAHSRTSTRRRHLRGKPPAKTSLAISNRN